jgi:phosphatidylglycerophosphatase A
MTALAVFINTFAYIGYFPFARGTVGAAGGLIVHQLIDRAGWAYGHEIAIVVLFALGVWSGTVLEAYFGRTDPGQGVMDEVVGMLITLYAIPVGWMGILVGFVLFRIADIIKPYPAARCEYLPGGLGMMADDAVAALYSHIALRGLWMAGIVG